MFKILQNRSKLYWIPVIITAIASYGFSMTNYSIRADDYAIYEYMWGNMSLAAGRWAGNILRYFIDLTEFTPFIFEFLSAILLVLSVTILGCIFQKLSKNSFSEIPSAIFSCVAISWSDFVYIAVFQMGNFFVAISFVLVAIAIYFIFNYCVYKNHFIYWIIGICILTFAIGCGEYCVPFFLIAVFFGIYLYMKNETISLKKLIGIIIKLISALILAILFYKLMSVFLQKLFNIESMNYTSSMISWSSISDIPVFIKDFILNLPRIVYPDISKGIYYMTYILGIIIMIGIIIFLCIKKKAILLIPLFFMLVSVFSLHMVTGNLFLNRRMIIYFSIAIAIGFSMLYLFIRDNFERPNIKKMLSNLLIICITLFVLSQTIKMNKMFYEDYKNYHSDLDVAKTVSHDMATEQISKSKPVVFVGKLPEPRKKYLDEISLSIFNLGRSTSEGELNQGHFSPFFKVNGYPLPPPALDVKESVISKQIKDMPIYPVPGYIKEYKDYTIICIGPSKINKISSK